MHWSLAAPMLEHGLRVVGPDSGWPQNPADYFSSLDIRRSASTLPPVWQVGQY